MVYYQKGREWRSKTQAHKRLSRNKLLFQAKDIQDGPFGSFVSFPAERTLGSKSRFAARILPFKPVRGFETLHVPESGGKSLPIPGSSLWNKHHPFFVDTTNESAAKDLEIKRNIGFRLFGRHHCFGFYTKKSSGGSFFHHADAGGSGFKDKPKEVGTFPYTGVASFGFSVGFQKRKTTSPSTKVGPGQKTVGKVGHNENDECQKNGSNFGGGEGLSTCPPISEGIYRQHVALCENSLPKSWDTKEHVPKELREQILEVKELMLSWEGRDFYQNMQGLVLHSDSSDFAWAGIDVQSKQVIQDFWRENSALHINQKEIMAAMNTVQSFASKGEHVTLCVDNVVTFAYLSKSGGRLCHLNALVRPFLRWCMDQKFIFLCNW
jgi:hypothetical protein